MYRQVHTYVPGYVQVSACRGARVEVGGRPGVSVHKGSLLHTTADARLAGSWAYEGWPVSASHACHWGAVELQIDAISTGFAWLRGCKLKFPCLFTQQALHPLSYLPGLCFQSLYQWFSTFLMLRHFNIVPHLGMTTPHHKSILLLLHSYKFATAMSLTVSIGWQDIGYATPEGVTTQPLRTAALNSLYCLQLGAAPSLTCSW